jgi:hypothetical protein
MANKLWTDSLELGMASCIHYYRAGLPVRDGPAFLRQLRRDVLIDACLDTSGSSRSFVP